jgi:hypothetical protein
MAAATYNLIVDQGSDWKITIIYKDAAGTVIPLTNTTAQLQFRTTYDSASPSLSLSTGSGITITANDGQIDIRATASQTGALSAGDYLYDLEITRSGEVTRIIQGRVTVTPQVTR